MASSGNRAARQGVPPFEITILGCGSATPTLTHSPTSQVLQYGSQAILIDCGEGTQLKLRRASFNFQRISHIFISHLHGDHCLGLYGLLSTMHLLGRTKEISIIAHEHLQEATEHQLRISHSRLRYPIHWHKLSYDGIQHAISLKNLDIFTFPLKHRIPTCGFLFKEKQQSRNISLDALQKYRPSVARIRQIKQGADLVLEDGTVVPNEQMTLAPLAPRSYAYCSDTAYAKETSGYVQGVDLLYHESTFLNAHADRAKATFHSTAAEAAQVAKDAKVGQLLLGHFSARYRKLQGFLSEAIPIFPNAILAQEGSTIALEAVHK